MDRFRIKAKMKRLKKWAANYNEKIDEVEKAKLACRKNALTSCWSFGEALQAKGFEVLGSGAFGTVYGYPGKDRVIKVINNPVNDGWLDFAHWAAQKGYAGKFAPQLYSYKMMNRLAKKDPNAGPWRRNSTGPFGVAVMERLEQTVGTTALNHDARAIDALFNHAMRDNALAAKMLDMVDKGLANFAKDLQLTFPRHLDMHGGNIMLRKDGSFVVTDPVAQMDSKIATMRLKVRDFTSLAAA